MRTFIQHALPVLFVLCISAGVRAQQHKTVFRFGGTVTQNVCEAMQRNADAVFNKINETYANKKRNLLLARENATPEAIQRIQALWSTSRFYSTEPAMIRPVAKMEITKKMQVRDVPIFFEGGKTREDQYQSLVIEFEPDGKIGDVYISLAQHQIIKFIEEGVAVTDLRYRQMVLGFVENFRTAYNRKDIDYLDKVFSNDALIITGKELKRNGDGLNPAGVDVEYVEQSKEAYIKKLKSAFARNRYINIKFDEIELQYDPGKPKVYGVTLRQEWNSSTYSDKGWLFLMIDFQNEENPQIWVRTWQPIWVPKEEIFWLGSFPHGQ